MINFNKDYKEGIVRYIEEVCGIKISDIETDTNILLEDTVYTNYKTMQ